MKKDKRLNHLYTVYNFGKSDVFISCGVFGCGKTYSAAEGLGTICRMFKEDCGLTRLTFIVAGKTQKAAKNSVGKALKKLWGKNYIPTKSEKDGYPKDALLFEQCILYVGNKSEDSEEGWRGNSDIVGVLLDEMTLVSEEQYSYIQGRLRGDFSEIREAISKLPENHPLRDVYLGFFHGATNPDNPEHWVKKMMDEGKCDYLNWTMEDACWNGHEEYYARLLKQYRPGSLHYRRYLLGEWTGAEGMVYSSFDRLENLLSSEEYNIEYKDFKRLILGIDYGSNHPTAIVLVGVNSDDIYIVLKEWKYTYTTVGEIVRKVKQIIDDVKREGSNIRSIYVDPSARALKDQLDYDRVYNLNAENEHISGIACIESKFYSKQLYIMDNCEELVKEIYGYTYKESRNGKDEVNKINDDLCDAMRYAVYSDTKAYHTGGEYK